MLCIKIISKYILLKGTTFNSALLLKVCLSVLGNLGNIRLSASKKFKNILLSFEVHYKCTFNTIKCTSLFPQGCELVLHIATKKKSSSMTQYL